MVVSVKTVN